MTMDPTLSCPNCGEEIKLTESLAAPMVAAVEEKYKALLAKKQADTDKQERVLRIREEAVVLEVDRIDERERDLEDRVQTKIKEGRDKIRIEEAAKANAILQKEMDAHAEMLKQNVTKLAEAQKAQVDALRKERELDGEKREMQLTIDKAVHEGINSSRAVVTQQVEERMQLKVREKEETIASMQSKIEDLRRKAEQGSQQMQGEAMELLLEESLVDAFRHDQITPVPKGVHGGDIVQVVDSNPEIGTILWELKNTKTWSNTWLAKLRDDQRAAKADVAVIVSRTMPKESGVFEMMEGVWVVSYEATIPVATMLRGMLHNVSVARSAASGMRTKAEDVYMYLTGPQFKSRVGAIVEAFTTMATDLEKEKRAINKQWAKREQQINRMMTATAGMSGDLQGIAGGELEEVEGLEMKALGEPES